MKASELIKSLQVIKEKYGDLDIIYDEDGAGNYHKMSDWNIWVGVYNQEDAEFYTNYNTDQQINSICINWED